jgi:hypothetical protein
MSHGLHKESADKRYLTVNIEVDTSMQVFQTSVLEEDAIVTIVTIR